jgi:hypothetical protein
MPNTNSLPSNVNRKEPLSFMVIGAGPFLFLMAELSELSDEFVVLDML